MLNEPFDNRIKFHILSEKIFLDSFNEKLIRSIFEETKFTHFEKIEKRKNVHVFMRCQFKVAKTPRNKNRFNEMLSCAFNNFRVWFIIFFCVATICFFALCIFHMSEKLNRYVQSKSSRWTFARKTKSTFTRQCCCRNFDYSSNVVFVVSYNL